VHSSILEGIHHKLEPIPATISEIWLLTGFRDVVWVPSTILQRCLVLVIPVPCNLFIRLAPGFGVAGSDVRKASGSLGLAMLWSSRRLVWWGLWPAIWAGCLWRGAAEVDGFHWLDGCNMHCGKRCRLLAEFCGGAAFFLWIHTVLLCRADFDLRSRHRPIAAAPKQFKPLDTVYIKIRRTPSIFDGIDRPSPGVPQQACFAALPSVWTASACCN
jgi:hypothetical protein